LAVTAARRLMAAAAVEAQLVQLVTVEMVLVRIQLPQ
jgi:hypothetical protein